MFNPKEIQLKDKELIKKYLPQSDNSMFNFTTIFMWSQGGKILCDIVDDCLVLFFKSKKNGVCCTYPTGRGDTKSIAQRLIPYMKDNSKKPRFILMTEDMAKECSEIFGKNVKISSIRDNADYVYLSENLINLSGKKLHQKKNHLNAFKSTYNFEYKKITDTKECIDLFEMWLKTQPVEAADFSRAPTIALLDNANDLGVTVGGIYVDNKLIAFSAGEMQTDDTALIHIEYADTSYRGAFNIINQQFVENEWSGATFINREEDMGLEGLRRAKLAYRPTKMVEKYNADFRG